MLGQIGHLWHQLIGHPSGDVVYILLKSLNCSNSDNWNNNVYEVCLRAKQTLTYFSVADNRAKELFDIIHCDTWGPYRVPSLCDARYFLTLVDDFSRSDLMKVKK